MADLDAALTAAERAAQATAPPPPGLALVPVERLAYLERVEQAARAELESVRTELADAGVFDRRNAASVAAYHASIAANADAYAVLHATLATDPGGEP